MCGTDTGDTHAQAQLTLRLGTLRTGDDQAYHEWETETLRYTKAVDVLPATAPGYFEELLAQRSQSSAKDNDA